MLYYYGVAIQWFGVDIGGTLVKCVYYETNDEYDEGKKGHKHKGIDALKHFVKSSLTYGSTGRRDQRLEMNDVRIGEQEGTLHFIKFATVRMEGFFDMVTKNGLSRFPKIICATGGGAFKFEEDFKKVSQLSSRHLHRFTSLLLRFLSPSLLISLSLSTLASICVNPMRCSV